MKNDNPIRYVSRFATTKDEIHIGWWVGKDFNSSVFTAKEKKKADDKYKQLKQQEEVE